MRTPKYVGAVDFDKSAGLSPGGVRTGGTTQCGEVAGSHFMTRSIVCGGWSLAKRWFFRGLSSAALITFAGVSFGDTPNTQTISVETGKNSDVYFEINLSGKVYLAIYAPQGGEACADFWWIKWPLGNTESLGRHCGSASFDVPGIFQFAVSAKLRVGGAHQPLKIVAAANEQIAHSITVHFP